MLKASVYSGTIGRFVARIVPDILKVGLGSATEAVLFSVDILSLKAYLNP